MGMIAGGGRLGLIAVRVRVSARLAVALVLLLGPVGGLLAAGMGGASAQPRPWLARGRAVPAGAGDLYGVGCTSVASCWAVGNSVDNLTEALHWNGQQWSQVATPSPGDYSDNLFGVACTSAADCWAVGTAAYSNFHAPNLALHWNGHTWSVVPTPSPYTGEGFNELLSVTCLSPKDCWAVGDDSAGGQALHWNGHRWSLVPTPGNAELSSVACVSSADCWAAGIGRGNAIVHWNGHTWAVVTAPVPGTASELSSIGCTSAASCWAVGGYGAGRITRSQALRWDGHRWSQAATPRPRGSVTGPRGLGGVACTSAADCWAVGPAVFPLGSMVNEAVHWNGHTWSYVTMPSPAPGDNPDLQAITCTSPANCWAVGYDRYTSQVLHWNGHHWSTA